jgi:hypothetical protein
MRHQMKLLLALFLVSVGVSACGDIGEREDLTSPCVGIEGSPCGEKRSVNDWWLA